MEEAKTVDLKLADGGESEEELWKNKPLLGIPLTVKESIALKGKYRKCNLNILNYLGKRKEGKLLVWCLNGCPVDINN